MRANSGNGAGKPWQPPLHKGQSHRDGAMPLPGGGHGHGHGHGHGANQPPECLNEVQQRITSLRLDRDIKNRPLGGNSSLMTSLAMSGLLDAEEIEASLETRSHSEPLSSPVTLSTLHDISNPENLFYAQAPVIVPKAPHRDAALDNWTSLLIDIGVPANHFIKDESKRRSSPARSVHAKINPTSQMLGPIDRSSVTNVSTSAKISIPGERIQREHLERLLTKEQLRISSTPLSHKRKEYSQSTTLRALNTKEPQYVDTDIARRYFGVTARHDFFDQFRELSRQGRNLLSESEVARSTSTLSHMGSLSTSASFFCADSIDGTDADFEVAPSQSLQLPNLMLRPSSVAPRSPLSITATLARSLNTASQSIRTSVNRGASGNHLSTDRRTYSRGARMDDFTPELHAWSVEYPHLFAKIDDTIIADKVTSRPANNRKDLTRSMDSAGSAVLGFSDSLTLSDSYNAGSAVSSDGQLKLTKSWAVNVVEDRLKQMDDFLSQMRLRTAEALDPGYRSSANSEGGQSSPRSHFIAHCIRAGITPAPNMILRRHLTTTLDLTGYGMGDMRAVLLADCLAELPQVEAINLTDNKLTDASIPQLLQAMLSMSALHRLDFSTNDFDHKSADALAHFLAHKQCPLVSLRISNADLSDDECVQFVNALKHNPSLTDLDLSANKMGASENRAAVNKNFVTAGESFAQYLSSKECKLKVLNLGWNSIRSTSGVTLSKAIASNCSLTYLDLSHNGMGNEAVEHLGMSAMESKTLRTLILPNNNFQASACMCLVAAFVENDALRRLVVDDNPIGLAGARALLQIPMFTGVPADISARACNTTMTDRGGLVDIAKPLGKHVLDLGTPVGRACAACLLQAVATHCSFTLAKAVLEYPGKRKRETLKLVQSVLRDRESHFDANQRKSIAALRAVVAAASNESQAMALFAELDEDGSGELDRLEVKHLLRELGLGHSENKLRVIFNTYDLDQRGFLDKDEFAHYLQDTALECKAKIQEMVELPIYASEDSPKTRFRIPKKGMLHLHIIDGYRPKPGFKLLTDCDAANVLEMAKSIENHLAVIEALKSVRLRHSEAIVVFERIRKQSNSPAKAIVDMLPLLDGPVEVGKFLATVTDGNRSLLAEVRRLSGSSFRPLLGQYNGFYRLNLEKPSDAQCLARLLAESKVSNDKRAERQRFVPKDLGAVGDLSQHRNWSCFRNERLNGTPYTIEFDKAEALQSRGVLEFDFSEVPNTLQPRNRPMTDSRLMKIMRNLFLMNPDAEASLMGTMRDWRHKTSVASGNVSGLQTVRPVFSFSEKKARECGVAMDDFYNNLGSRSQALKAAGHLEEVNIDITKPEGPSTSEAAEHQVTLSDITGFGAHSTTKKGKEKGKGGKNRKASVKHLGKSKVHKSASVSSLSFADGDDDGDDDDDNHALVEDDGSGLSMAAVAVMLADMDGSIPTDLQHHVDLPSPQLLLSTSGSSPVHRDHGGSRVSSPDSVVSNSTITTRGNQSNVNGKVQAIADRKRRAILDLFHRLRLLLRHSQVSPHAKAANMCDAIVDALAPFGTVLHARQLAAVLYCFKARFGATKRTAAFGSYLCDVAVALYPRVVDVHNLELVLQAMSGADCGAFLCRIGLLHAFNPCKPEGFFELNMGRPEERLVSKMIVYLCKEEPGVNLGVQTLQWKRDMPVTPGWSMNETWLKEETMPSSGYFFYQYISRSSTNPMARRALLQLVAAEEELIDREIQLHAAEDSPATVAAVITAGLPSGNATGTGSQTVVTNTAVRHFQKNRRIWIEYLAPDCVL